MSAWAAYFLNSDANVVQLELLEISHPNFTHIYRVVRNKADGVTVTLEDSTVQTFDYFPCQIKQVGNSDDLDQAMQIQLGDLGQLLPIELDAIKTANGFTVKPIMKYRTYRSDDLTAPLSGPMLFEIVNLSTTDQGAAFEARAPRLNQVSTGLIYNTRDIPMLGGFI